MSEPKTPASLMAYAQEMLSIIDSRLSELPADADPEVRLNLVDARAHYIVVFEHAVKAFSNA